MRSETNRDVPALTGLRGIAALVVVVYHYLQAPTVASGHIHSPFSGYLGVELFFILSGYLMGLNYGAAFGHQIVSIRVYFSFLGKRFARVYPLYAVMTVLAFGVWFAVLYPGHLRYRILFTNLVLAQQLGPGLIEPGLGDSILGGAWSISTEVGAYLLFPLLYFSACQTKGVGAIITLSISIAVLVVLATIPDYLKPQQLTSQGPLDVWSGWNLWPLARCLSEFTIGLFLLRFTRSGLPRFLTGDVASTLIPMLLVIALFISRADIPVVFLISMLVLHIGSSVSRVTRFLSSRALIWLGEVSYSIYLLHVSLIMITYERPVLIFQSPWFHSRYWLVLTTTLVLLFVLSRLAFNYIERPSRRLLRTLFDSPKQPIAQEPSIP